MFTQKQRSKTLSHHPALLNSDTLYQSKQTKHVDLENFQNFFLSEKTAATAVAFYIVHEISYNKVFTLSDGSTEPDFFDHIENLYSKPLKKAYGVDADVLQVLERQITILLKETGLIQSKFGYYTLSSSHLPLTKDASTFLFDQYWHKTNWLTFFPSMPSIAGHFFANRKVIARLLTNAKKATYLDSIAIDYLLETNLNYRNELIFISFFDFAVISWLNMLGLTTYTLQNSNGRIKTNLTQKGRDLFSDFLKIL